MNPEYLERLVENLRNDWVKTLNNIARNYALHPWELLDVSSQEDCLAGVSCRSKIIREEKQLVIQGLYYALSYLIDKNGNPCTVEPEWSYGEIPVDSPLVPFPFESRREDCGRYAIYEAEINFTEYFD